MSCYEEFALLPDQARELGLAGATVLRGPMGFGANSRMHTSKLLELSTDLPIVIEIVRRMGRHRFRRIDVRDRAHFVSPASLDDTSTVQT